MLIAIEGLPGAGKTTSAGLVAERLGGHVLRETTAHHPFLESVYRDDDRHDLEVELAFLLLHSSAWRHVDRSLTTVADFSRVKDVLFAEDMLADGADRQLFDLAYARLYEGYPPAELVVYLKATPELCLRRAQTRLAMDPRREFEKGLTLERLARMKELYEARLDDLGDEVLVLDLDEVLDESVGLTASTTLVAEEILRLLSDHLPLALRSRFNGLS